MDMWQIWVIIAGVFFILELATVGFLLFWVGIAALLAMIISLFIENIIIQTTVFVISSGILILFSRKIVNKYVKPKNFIPTNANSLIGAKGLVTVTIDSTLGTGQIKVNGEVWSARADTKIEKGTNVEILKIDGVKLVVNSISEHSIV